MKIVVKIEVIGSNNPQQIQSDEQEKHINPIEQNFPRLSNNSR
jgi:hypothetical protein